mmetsp:Transcript_24800/g.62965  ORF Transcript_24800/g.62965 Transcript_24800/m.62965 type:complete len:248 (+) Transcript_24800:186-929(+)
MAWASSRGAHVRLELVDGSERLVQVAARALGLVIALRVEARALPPVVGEAHLGEMGLQRVPPGAHGRVALARERRQPEAEQHHQDGDAQALDEHHVRAARLRRGVDRDAALRRAEGGPGGDRRRIDRRASRRGLRRRLGRSEGMTRRRGRGGRHVRLILLAVGCAVRAAAALAELAMVARFGGLAERAARDERQVALQPRLTLRLLGLGAARLRRRVATSSLLHHLLGPAWRRRRTPSKRWAQRGWC